MTAGLAPALRELRRAATLHRRLLAAGLAAASVAFGLSALAPQRPRLVVVLVAAHDLGAGASLGRGDLRPGSLPPDAVPAGALRPDAPVLGRLLAGPVRRGEPVTDVRLVGPALLDALGTDLVAAPVRLADPGTAALLHAGDAVDVLAADAGGARVVAGGVRVLTVPATPDSGPTEGALVLLAVSPAEAVGLARAAVAARLSVALRGNGTP